MKTFDDALQHFLFESFSPDNLSLENQVNKTMPIRGNVIHLNHTVKQALQHQSLPTVLKQALGELMAASALLAAALKMEGVMVLQLQGKGVLKLLVVECSSNLEIRATAKWDNDRTDEIAQATFLELIQNGHFIITLDPNNGEAYQGIVPIEGSSIAEMLQNYMLRSQQIDTSLWLHCDGENAAGMLLQKLPNVAEHDTDSWNRVNILANTMTDDELQNLAPETLLTRLFAEENIRLFDAKPTRFYCGCSKAKVGNMLRMLGVDEVNSILAERQKIEVNCDFCNKHYAFDVVDATALFASETIIHSSDSRH